MNLKEIIKSNIKRMESDMGIKYWDMSASGLTLQPVLERTLCSHSEGKLLDAGAGDLLCKPLLDRHCEQYDSLDIVDNPELDYTQDIQNMELPDDRYDTVFCRNVLEHVPYPDEAMDELYRVLKPGGSAIVTVPHLAYLHNEPHDYYRFTSHALENMADDAGFTVEAVRPVGGFFSFVGYSLSTFLLGLTYHFPVISSVVLWVNYVLQWLFVRLDDMTGNAEVFPLNYVIVLRK